MLPLLSYYQCNMIPPLCNNKKFLAKAYMTNILFAQYWKHNYIIQITYCCYLEQYVYNFISNNYMNM